jgi:hypothetical protein
MYAAQKEIEKNLSNMHNINWSLMAPSLVWKSIEELRKDPRVNVAQYEAHFAEYKAIYLGRLEREIETIFILQEKYPEYGCKDPVEIEKLLEKAKKEDLDVAKIAGLRARIPQYCINRLLLRAENAVRQWPGNFPSTGETITVENVYDLIGEANVPQLSTKEREKLKDTHRTFVGKRIEEALRSPDGYSSCSIIELIHLAKLHGFKVPEFKPLLEAARERERFWDRTSHLDSALSDLEASVSWHVKETRGREEWLAEDVVKLPGIRKEIEKIAAEGFDVTEFEERMAGIEGKIQEAGCGALLV